MFVLYTVYPIPRRGCNSALFFFLSKQRPSLDGKKKDKKVKAESFHTKEGIEEKKRLNRRLHLNPGSH